MNPRLQLSICFSLAFHLLAALLIWQQQNTELSGTRNTSIDEHGDGARAFLHISIVQHLGEPDSARAMPASATPLIAETGGLISTPHTNDILLMPFESDVQVGDAAPYFTAGQLTQAPRPIDNIDLGMAEIDDLSSPIKITLTLLIGSSGLVDEIITNPTSDDEAIFTSRVITQFRKALFIPGQVDGRAVRSRLNIVVVAEPRSAGSLTSETERPAQ